MKDRTKKALLVGLALLCLCLTACGGSGDGGQQKWKGAICLTEEQLMSYARVVELTAENWKDYFRVEVMEDRGLMYSTIEVNTGDAFAYIWYNDKDCRYSKLEFQSETGKTETYSLGMTTIKQRVDLNAVQFIGCNSKLVLFDIPENLRSTDADGTQYIYYGAIESSGSVSTLQGGRVNQGGMAKFGNIQELLKTHFGNN